MSWTRFYQVGACSVVSAIGGSAFCLEKGGMANAMAPIKCQDGTTVIPWEAPTRDDHIQKLKNTSSFDVIVIGGGATGCGCALDAATRGLNVALLERDDFSAGTSGRSTKLIHGGIRYLQTAFLNLDWGAFKLVQEALEEREHMLIAAPYMNRPLPIMIPIYTLWEVPYMWIGAKVYDLVAGSKRCVPNSYWISADEAMYQFPMLHRSNLKGAIVYYDGQMNDSRMGVTIGLTAAQSGATICNRVEVLRLLKDEKGNVSGVFVRDNVTGDQWEIKAKAVINATGPFSDGIRKMDNKDAEDIIVPAAGVHVVLPDHFSPQKMGLIVPKTKDGRVLFFLPWENGTLAGTTDSESPITMTPSPSQPEIEFIIEEANRYLDKTVRRSDVRSAWSGIRPLAKDPKHLGEETSKISREHVIEVSPSRLITIAGGKWTTYRRMAQDTIDRMIEVVPALRSEATSCKTKNMQLVGADRVGQVCEQKFDIITVTLREKYQLDRDVAEHLMRNYGTRALQVAEIQKNGFLNCKSGHPQRLLAKYPWIEAEVVFNVRQEYAIKAIDIIARRTRIAFVDSTAAAQAVPKVVELMGDLLGWSKSKRQQETKECHEFLETMHKRETSVKSGK